MPTGTIAEAAVLWSEVETVDLSVAFLAEFLLKFVENRLLYVVLLLAKHWSRKENNLCFRIDVTDSMYEVAVCVLVESGVIVVCREVVCAKVDANNLRLPS